MSKHKKEGPAPDPAPADAKTAAPADAKAAAPADAKAAAAPADAPADTADGDKTDAEVPLIDEDIFDGEVDTTEIEVGNLFEPSEADTAAAITADDIPDGVDV